MSEKDEREKTNSPSIIKSLMYKKRQRVFKTRE